MAINVSVHYNGGLLKEKTVMVQKTLGEKPTVIMYTYIAVIAMQGHLKKQ